MEPEEWLEVEKAIGKPWCPIIRVKSVKQGLYASDALNEVNNALS